MRDHTARPDNCSLSDSDAGKNHTVGPDRNIVLNDDWVSLMSLLADGHIAPGKHMVGGTKDRVGSNQHILADINSPASGAKENVLVKGTPGSNVQFSVLIRIERATSHQAHALSDRNKLRFLNNDLIAKVNAWPERVE